ncbi:hypothetical protein WDU94_010795 [Cyamophila willieti]
MSIFDRGMRLVRYFEGLRPIMGDDLYSLLSIWESLMLGFVILAKDDVQFEDLYVSQYEEMAELVNKHHIELEYDLLLPQSRTDEEVCLMLELLGLMKHFEYPILRSEEILDPLKMYGVEQNSPIDPMIMRKVMGITKLKQAALLFPIEFGGLPLSNYNNHLVRGHPDQVTIWLGILLIIRQIRPNIFNHLKYMAIGRRGRINRLKGRARNKAYLKKAARHIRVDHIEGAQEGPPPPNFKQILNLRDGFDPQNMEHYVYMDNLYGVAVEIFDQA